MGFHRAHAGFRDLLESIRTLGIQTPLLIASIREEAVLLHGCARLRAAMELEIHHLPVRILSPEQDPEAIMEALYLEHHSQAPLNLIEKAAFLNTVMAMVPNADRMAWLSRLSLPPRPRTLESLAKLGLASAVWQDFFVSRNVPLKRVESLLNSACADELEILIKQGVGLNKIEQIAEKISELSVLSGRPEAELLAECLHESEEHCGESCGAAALTAALLENLGRRRMPQLSAYRENVEKLLDGLEMPGFVQLVFDPGYEKPGFRLSADLEDPQRLQQFKIWFEKAGPVLRKIAERDLEP